MNQDIVSHQRAAGNKLSAAGIFVRALTIFIAFENLIGSFLYRVVGNDGVAKCILYSKYLVFLCGFLLFFSQVFMGRRRIGRTDVIALAYLTWVMSFVPSALLGAGPFREYAYLYVVPIFVYFSGRLMPTELLAGFLLFLVRITIFLIVFGLVDYFFLDDFLWQSVVNYGAYISDIKGMSEILLDGLPGNFYFDPWGLHIRRMVSSFGDPLAFAYFILIVFCLYWFSVRPGVRIKGFAPLCVIGLLLSITRAIVLVIPMLIVLNALFGRRAFIAAFCVGVAGVVLSQFQVSTDYSVDSSSAGHLTSNQQFSEEIDSDTLLFGRVSDADAPVFEPAYMNMLTYFGIVGTLLFTLLVVHIFNYTRIHMLGIALTFAGGTLTLLLFSQSFLSTSASWLAWFLAGWAIRPIAPQPRERSLKMSACICN